VTRVSCTPSEQKAVPGTGPAANPPTPPSYYYQIPLMYNFGTAEKPVLNEFLFEGCELETKGIQSKLNQQARMEHSIMSKFDGNNPDHNRMIEAINHIHAGCCYIIQQMRGAVKLYDFNAQAPGGLFKNPIYRARDEVTGEFIPGRAPAVFFKLFDRGPGQRTLFTGPDGKEIDWELLKSVDMKYIPLIHIKRIFCGGGKASLQMEVVSAVVTKVVASGSVTRQLPTIHNLQQSRPELVDTVSAQLAKLTTDRQDQLLGGTGLPPAGQNPGSGQPTYTGIAPTGGRQMAQNIAPALPAPLPNIPALGSTQPTMQDFTAAAPQRGAVIPAVHVPGSQTPSPSTKTALSFN
jgi:hypothetical protein